MPSVKRAKRCSAIVLLRLWLTVMGLLTLLLEPGKSLFSLVYSNRTLSTRIW